MARGKPTTISTADLFEEINVDIEGTKFRLREGTRSVEEQHRALSRECEKKEERLEEIAAEFDKKKDDKEAKDLEEQIIAELLDLLGDSLNIWLEPLGEAKTKPKTVIKKAYKDDTIGLSGLQELARQIGSAGQQRPT